MDYNTKLNAQFKDLKINLVKHDTSGTGLPAYIEVHLKQMPKLKDRGELALDLGNYIYRTFGLAYQMTPEFRGRGKNTTIRWFMSWDNINPLIPQIKEKFNCKIAVTRYLPYEFNTLIIQDIARGVCPREAA